MAEEANQISQEANRHASIANWIAWAAVATAGVALLKSFGVL